MNDLFGSDSDDDDLPLDDEEQKPKVRAAFIQSRQQAVPISSSHLPLPAGRWFAHRSRAPNVHRRLPSPQPQPSQLPQRMMTAAMTTSTWS